MEDVADERLRKDVWSESHEIRSPLYLDRYLDIADLGIHVGRQLGSILDSGAVELRSLGLIDDGRLDRKSQCNRNLHRKSGVETAQRTGIPILRIGRRRCETGGYAGP